MIKKILKYCCCFSLLTGLSQAQEVTISIDAGSERKPISPYIFGKNNSLSDNSADPLNDAEWQRLRDMGIRFFRENGGNNATKYNWRRKLSSHPDWYNNVYAHNWDYAASNLGLHIPSAQGMWAFQLIGKAAKTSSANFNDWAYNNSVWWSGCGQNLAGGGTVNPAGGGDALADGNPDLYLETWNADSTTGILDHWFGAGGIGLDKNKIRYWSMDNEPEIWNGTHDDLIVNQPTAEEFIQLYFAVAKSARAKYPGIKLTGPVPANEWQWYNWNGEKITYNGKQYVWLEYFIMRIAEEQQASGIRLLDVLDIHFYPGDSSAADITQLHRVFFDTTYNYPGANGVKRVGASSWDNTITKEYIFKRCNDWLNKYIGPDHGVTLALTETSIAKRDNPTLTANWYASTIGEFIKHGVEIFTPWDWATGMSEVVHLYSKFGKSNYIPAESSDEYYVSAYPSINNSSDSITVFFVNRHLTESRQAVIAVKNFYIKDGTYKLFTLSGLPATETFISHTNNALKETDVDITGNTIAVSLPALSVSALVLAKNEIVYNQYGRLISAPEAENGFLRGTSVSASLPGYTGSGYVTGFDDQEDTLSLSFNIDKKNLYRVVLRYSANTASSQELTLNDSFSTPLSLPASSAFVSMDAGCFVFEEGLNTLKFSHISGEPFIDRIEVYEIEAKTYAIDQALTDDAANDETRDLYLFLQYQFGNRIISGQTSDHYDEVKSLTGKSPMIRDGDFQHFSQGYAYFWVDGIGHTFGYDIHDHSVDSLIRWHQNTGNKGIVAMQWHWHSPMYGDSAGTNTFYTDYTSFDIRQAVIPGTPEYNATIRDIDSIATMLRKFQNAGIPVLWRPLHEAGGGWFWWGARGSEPCLALWDILRDRLINHHQLHNLIWVWSTPEPEWYPGNDKVDIIGYDSYPGSFNYSTRKEIYDNLYMITRGKKLIAMSENGPIPDPDSCIQKDSPWLYFNSWSNLVTEQNSTDHILDVYNNPLVLCIESENAKTGFDWRSALYPENWKPGFKDSQGRFLHDFSYAGYHKGEMEIPGNHANIIDVTREPYYADNTGATDATNSIQQALNDAGSAGGGIVYLPQGKYTIHATDTFALRISYDNTVIRGDGPDRTFIQNTATSMRYKDMIRLKNNGGNWFSPLGIPALIRFDLTEPTRIIPVQSASGFSKGDPVVITSSPTEEFIAEHRMTGYWNADIKGVAFMRRIDSVDLKNNLVIIDAPTRYPLKTRDQARIYKISEPLKECGIENLSIGNIAHTGSGWEEESYSQPGTGAYDVHFSEAIHFINAENCWLKNVHTFRPQENTGDYHLLSNGVKLNQCRFITIDSCVFEKSQYEGGGGNGYMFTIESNDCLIKNSTANDGRHNFDFKYPYSNGNVIHKCRAENSRYASDFHMYFSMANLFDACTINGDYLESAFRPYGSPLHGYTSTQSVFYNTYGEAYHDNRDYLIESKQFGNGYIIGTSGPAYNVTVDPAEGIMNGYSYNTLPRDFKEGIGNGQNLVPQSLYMDQLEKRIENSYPVTGFRVRVFAMDKLTREIIPGCTIIVNADTVTTDSSGQAIFTGLPGFIELKALKLYYDGVENRPHFINTDSTFIVDLIRKKYDLTIQLLKAHSMEPVNATSFTLGSLVQVTDSYGKTVFQDLYGGDFSYSVSKPYYADESGIITLGSDTSVVFYLVKTEASLRIRLRNGTIPVNNALVIADGDSVLTNSLGDALFSYLPVSANYNYSISKAGFEAISGSLFLVDDTILVVAMLPVVSADQKEESNLRIWPNPAYDVLCMSIALGISGSTVVIIDMKGTEVLRHHFNEPEVCIPLNGLSEGNYIIRIISGENVWVRNFSIKT